MEKLSKAERIRMANDRRETLAWDSSCMEDRERNELQAEVDLLLTFTTPVGFDGNNVVRIVGGK